MNDRRRLLILSILVLAGVSLSGVAFTAYRLAPAAGVIEAARLREALWFAMGSTAVFIFAGATLLLRVSRPFVLRLEESESLTRAIIQTAVDGIVTLDILGVVRAVNPAAEELFGQSAALLIGRNAGSIIVHQSAQGLGAMLNGRPDERNAVVVKGIDALVRRNDGILVPVEVSVGEHLSGDERLYTLMVRDVTERRLAEEQTRRHVEQLQAAAERLELKAAELTRMNQALDDFTYVASHDLKEPLRGISSYCNILLEEYQAKLDDDGRRMLGALVVLCQRLGQLIDDLLAYSRMGRAPERDMVDLDLVLDAVLDTLGPAIDARGGAVRRLERLPTLEADSLMVREVFQNLISNGLKFNESDPPTVEIGWLEGNPPTIYVRDNGIGIAERYREAVFGIFRRLHGRNKYEGTGAGLSIVRKIIEGHGGRIWFDSEPGSGSTFYFTLAQGKVDCTRAPLELAERGS